jgi:hypothetical protein
MRFGFSPGSASCCPRSRRATVALAGEPDGSAAGAAYRGADGGHGSETDTHAVASREILFMQLLVLLRKSSLAEEATNNDAR